MTFYNTGLFEVYLTSFMLSVVSLKNVLLMKSLLLVKKNEILNTS